MWGVGVVCSLLLMSFAGSWAFKGKFGYRMSAPGSEVTGEIRKDEAPIRFWIIVGSFLAASAAGTIVTVIGLSKVQRQENENGA